MRTTASSTFGLSAGNIREASPLPVPKTSPCGLDTDRDCDTYSHPLEPTVSGSRPNRGFRTTHREGGAA
jgi:hypothetical protein